MTDVDTDQLRAVALRLDAEATDLDAQVAPSPPPLSDEPLVRGACQDLIAAAAAARRARAKDLRALSSGISYAAAAWDGTDVADSVPAGVR